MVVNNILITGSEGQLGSSIKEVSTEYNHNLKYVNSSQLDITNFDEVNNYLSLNKFDFIINCAAFTDVNESEINFEIAKKINGNSLDNLAKNCLKNKLGLIHISTDYVFDGNKNTPYMEDDVTKPINMYGESKLIGENKILSYNLSNSIIIRTSWLYSKYQNNFVAKIIKKILSGVNFSVVDDEIGSPTNARDLAKTILEIIPNLKNKKTQIYHYSNIGECSRYELACKINSLIKGSSKIKPVSSQINIANRPKYSALSSQKLIDTFGIKINSWDSSLKGFLTDNSI